MRMRSESGLSRLVYSPAGGRIEFIGRLYDENETVSVEGELGAFLVLLHLCGIEHQGEFPLLRWTPSRSGARLAITSNRC